MEKIQSKKVLVRFYKYMGRGANLEGMFISTEEKVKNMMGKEVHLGEVAGKHSEVSVTLGADDISIISEDQEFIEKLQSVFKSERISGLNPFDYYEEQDEENE